MQRLAPSSSAPQRRGEGEKPRAAFSPLSLLKISTHTHTHTQEQGSQEGHGSRERRKVFSRRPQWSWALSAVGRTCISDEVRCWCRQAEALPGHHEPFPTLSTQDSTLLCESREKDSQKPSRNTSPLSVFFPSRRLCIKNPCVFLRLSFRKSPWEHLCIVLWVVGTLLILTISPRIALLFSCPIGAPALKWDFRTK